MPAHRVDLKVRFYELDPYGHLNHATFVQFFETARIELLEEVGLDLASFDERGYRFVVSRIETSFLRPVYASDVVTVETEIVDLRRASTTWSQRLRRGDELVAKQELRAAITDSTGRPVRVPDYLASSLSPYFA